MNTDMLSAGVALGDEYEFDLVHGHDWLVASPATTSPVGLTARS